MIKYNNLIDEKSPYLRQHSTNPVNWYPWGPEAFSLAKKNDLPIFLSIGYSTCYWCHVMERECFENEEIANLMNESFINIKVDREERAEIDRIYMSALQSMTGSGGWPMSMFLTPDLKPFYGATYIPPKSKYNRAGFEDVIEQINNLWRKNKNDLLESSEKINTILNSKLKGNRENINISEDVFENCFRQSKELFDFEYGGFGSGNKFPRPVLLNFLLTYCYFTKEKEALDIVTYTLKKIIDGGIYDQIDGGLHRYAVDSYWRVPHFEKMLYDQAQVSNILFDVYKITNDINFLTKAEEILSYVLKYLFNNKGGFYSAEDAESIPESSNSNEKEEGYFYLWTKNDIDNILGNDSDIFCFAYGIKPEGNTIFDPHKVFKNRNVIYIAEDIFETAKQFNLNIEEVETILQKSLLKLKEVRNKRKRPDLDNKILLNWNSLLLIALSNAYKVTNKNIYLEKAIITYNFIMNNLYNNEEKILHHRYIDGESKFEANLEDYAFFIKSTIDLYEISFNSIYLTNAVNFTNQAIKKFYDSEAGGFFDTSKEKKDIIFNTKEIYDGAEPSGNSIMIESLFRLEMITGIKEYREYAEKSIEYFYNEIKSNPFSHPQMLVSLYYLLKPAKEIIFTYLEKSSEFDIMINYLNKKFIPNKIVLKADLDTSKIAKYLKEIIPDFEKFKFYVCENFACNLPVDNLNELKKIL